MICHNEKTIQFALLMCLLTGPAAWSCATLAQSSEAFLLTTLSPDLNQPFDTVDETIRYGHSVSISNDFLIIGAPRRRHESGDRLGASFLYQRVDGAWQLHVTYLGFPSNPGTGSVWECGTAVAALGLTEPDPLQPANPKAAWMITGCPAYSSNRGLVRFDSTGLWSGGLANSGAPMGANPGDRCGAAVAVAGNGWRGQTWFAMGCPGRGPAGPDSSRGEVDIYFHPEEGLPTLEATLAFESALPPINGAHWRFGESIAMRVSSSGTLFVAVGAPGYSSKAGRVFLFERTAPGQFEEIAVRSRPGGNRVGAEFGYSLALDGLHWIIGAPGDGSAIDSDGRVYAYQRVLGGDGWSSGLEINPSGIFSNQNDSRFGHTVALKGTSLWIGQPFWRNPEGNRRGRVMRYTRTSSGLLDPLVYSYAQAFFDERSLVLNEGELGYALAADNSTEAVAGYPSYSRFNVPETKRWGQAWFLGPRPDALFNDRFQTPVNSGSMRP